MIRSFLSTALLLNCCTLLIKPANGQVWTATIPLAYTPSVSYPINYIPTGSYTVSYSPLCVSHSSFYYTHSAQGGVAAFTVPSPGQWIVAKPPATSIETSWYGSSGIVYHPYTYDGGMRTVMRNETQRVVREPGLGFVERRAPTATYNNVPQHFVEMIQHTEVPHRTYNRRVARKPTVRRVPKMKIKLKNVTNRSRHLSLAFINYPEGKGKIFDKIFVLPKRSAEWELKREFGSIAYDISDDGTKNYNQMIWVVEKNRNGKVVREWRTNSLDGYITIRLHRRGVDTIFEVSVNAA